MEEQRKNSDNGDHHQQKLEDIVLPGFRFHPTDEELVGFYLKRKIQQRPLSIELIKQLDIYKFDPWDLPKMAASGEKEWYFFCPRDRKYRNSARPNRVTRAGFWKATGTDRPVYSTTDGSSPKMCIGLKKSLVFYKGRAAKGVKTDWMMHEFRLPSVNDHSFPSRRSSSSCLDKSVLTSSLESWAICRIFKKTTSVAQRSVSQSWVSPSLPMIPQQPTNSPTTSNINCSNTSTTKSPPNPYHHHYNSLTPSKSQSSFSTTHQIFNSINDSSRYMTTSTAHDSHGLFSLTSYNDHKPTFQAASHENETTSHHSTLHNFPTHLEEYTTSYQNLLPPLVDALTPQLEPPPTPSPTNHHHFKIDDNMSTSPPVFCGHKATPDITETYNSLDILHEQFMTATTTTNNHFFGAANFSQDEAVRVMDRFDRGDDLWDVVQSIGVVPLEGWKQLTTPST